MTDTKANPYERITAKIFADLERGVRSWTKPWSAEHLGGRVVRPLRATGERYSGINVELLWMEAVANGYTSPTWMTYRQAQALGGQVRRGETGAPVVYCGQATKARFASREACTKGGHHPATTCLARPWVGGFGSIC